MDDDHPGVHPARSWASASAGAPQGFQFKMTPLAARFQGCLSHSTQFIPSVCCWLIVCWCLIAMRPAKWRGLSSSKCPQQHPNSTTEKPDEVFLASSGIHPVLFWQKPKGPTSTTVIYMLAANINFFCIVFTRAATINQPKRIRRRHKFIVGKIDELTGRVVVMVNW